MIIRDYHAPLKHEAEIAIYTSRLRTLAGIKPRFPISVIEALKFLTTRPLPRKGKLYLSRTDHADQATPAYVTFDPLTLHVDDDLWAMAALGDPYCRFVLAHELGHIVLHSDGMQSYSGKSSDYTSKGFEEQSAEWQADMFAFHYLAPDDLAKLSVDAQDLSDSAVIRIDKAEKILASLNRRKLWQKPAQCGEMCGSCQCFTLMRNSVFTKCRRCGAQTFAYST